MSSDHQPNLFVVSGPSGAGKSTLLARVLASVTGLRFSVSHTTRPPRPGEEDGVQYHFVTEAAFRRLIQQGQFLEWAEVHGHLYGTCRTELERAAADGVDLLLDVDVQGAAQVRAKFRDTVTVFILPPSYQALESRLRGRGMEDERALARRLAAARAELGLFHEYDYAIVNDNIEESARSLGCVVRAARTRTGRAEARCRGILDTFPSSASKESQRQS